MGLAHQILVRTRQSKFYDPKFISAGRHQNQCKPENSSKKIFLLLRHGLISLLSIIAKDWCLFCWIGPSATHIATPTCFMPDEVALVQSNCKKSSSINIGSFLIHNGSKTSLVLVKRRDDEFCSLLSSWRGTSNAIVHLVQGRARTPTAPKEALAPKEW